MTFCVTVRLDGAKGKPLPPDWLDRDIYPFAPHYFETAAGRLHYVDESAGPPVVLVHGTPTWSLLWRRLIRALIQPSDRCEK